MSYAGVVGSHLGQEPGIAHPTRIAHRIDVFIHFQLWETLDIGVHHVQAGLCYAMYSIFVMMKLDYVRTYFQHQCG